MAKLTEENKKDIVKKYEAGFRTSRIAKEYGIDISGIKRIMKKYKKYGLDGLVVKHTKRKFTEAFKCEVLNCVDIGESIDSVALKYDIDHSTICNWRRKRDENKTEIVHTNFNEGKNDAMKDNEINDVDLTAPLTDEERKELLESRKKIKQLEMENEILKKLRALVLQRIEQPKKKK